MSAQATAVTVTIQLQDQNRFCECCITESGEALDMSQVSQSNLLFNFAVIIFSLWRSELCSKYHNNKKTNKKQYKDLSKLSWA